jgi:hypothetical protein
MGLDESMTTSLNFNPLEYDSSAEAGTISGANRFTIPSEKTCRKPGISGTMNILVIGDQALMFHTKQWRTSVGI